MDLKARIFSKGPPCEVVHIREWGEDVLVVGMTGEQRDEIDRLAIGAKNGVPIRNLRAVIARMCAYDPDTAAPIFTREEEADIAKLSGSALDRILAVAQRLSGISADAVDAEKKT